MSFKEFGLTEKILEAIEDAGYTTPTPIQKEAIPIVLSGSDLLAGSQTGSGKTAGFTLPLLQNLMKNRIAKNRSFPRALILTPTRELAAQVEESVKTYGKHLPLRSAAFFGGVNINPQINKLRSGLDIVVATPGRLLDLSNQKAIDLSQIEILVLDEADRMLDMGFIHDIRKILKLLPSKKQSLLFSATFSSEIKKLAETFLHAPQMIQATKNNEAAPTISHIMHPVDTKNKANLLSHLITFHKWNQVLVFTRTKHGANKLTASLSTKGGIQAAAIHGNKSQTARTKALADFKNGTIQVLVATDIAARGLDIENLPCVVNFDLPQVPADYIHRIGRTGRAGQKGNAISLVSIDENELLKDIERLLKEPIKKITLEGFEPDPTISPKPISRGASGHRQNKSPKPQKTSFSPKKRGFRPFKKAK
jgi:ATP-dependent RNA helicase RhlE